MSRRKQKVISGNDEPRHDDEAEAEQARQQGIVEMEELRCGGSECRRREQLEQQQ